MLLCFALLHTSRHSQLNSPHRFLYHQKEMLEDGVRMRAYHDAVFLNKQCFEGKTVLDVGTGSGILAVWAAQAGARKVYAVEVR